MDPLVELLRHRPLPELASALRARSASITDLWTEAVRHAIPRMKAKTFDQLEDSLPAIIEAMAKAVSATDDDEMAMLVQQSPVQGLTRFHQDYSVTEIMQEDRLLRGIIVTEVEGHLRRQMDAPESAVLHAVIDVMLQRAVVALVEEQQAKLRAVAEKELRYLSFLSHDLNNNLNGVLLTLHLAAQQLESSADRSEVAGTLREASGTIAGTVGGMRQLLEHARLKEGTANGPDIGPLDLHELASSVIRQFARDAAGKGLLLAADVPPGTVVEGNRELLSLVMQNLVGNAVKYSFHGSVRVTAEHRDPGTPRGRRVIAVSDQGPGIPPDRRAMLFEAFRRGEAHGQPGVGLGLAIAAQAAELMGAELAVDSAVGVGSTFSVSLPDRSGRAADARGWIPAAPHAWGRPTGGQGIAT